MHKPRVGEPGFRQPSPDEVREIFGRPERADPNRNRTYPADLRDWEGEDVSPEYDLTMLLAVRTLLSEPERLHPTSRKWSAHRADDTPCRADDPRAVAWNIYGAVGHLQGRPVALETWGLRSGECITRWRIALQELGRSRHPRVRTYRTLLCLASHADVLAALDLAITRLRSEIFS